MQVNRTETKYIINQLERAQLLRRLDPIMSRDSHSASSEGYEVRSLYFDSLDDRCCREKADGLQIHEKIRVRVYGTDDSIIKLESKRKNGSAQVKQSLLIDRKTLEALCRGQYAVLLKLQDPKAAYFYEKLAGGMFPKSIIQYQRLSLCLNVNDIRITFDSNIRATECCTDLFQEPLQAHPILPADLTVLEIKYNHFLLGYIKDALQNLKQSPTSYSKYFNGRSYYRNFI